MGITLLHNLVLHGGVAAQLAVAERALPVVLELAR
jgi:hypothetical protein